MFYVSREKKLKYSLQCSKSTFLPNPRLIVTWFFSVSNEDSILKHILQNGKALKKRITYILSVV